MATYLGVYFAPNLISGNWLAKDCSNTAADYHLAVDVAALSEKVGLVLAAASNANYFESLDQAESGLWLLRGDLETLRAKSVAYTNWLIGLAENTGFLGGAREESCNQNQSTLQLQIASAIAIEQAVQAMKTLVINRLALVQAMQEDEYTEEQIENQLQQQQDARDKVRLKLVEDEQRVRAIEFMNNLQQVLLPLLAVSLGVVLLYRRK